LYTSPHLLHLPLPLLFSSTERRVQEAFRTLSSTHLLSPQRSKRPLLVFLSNPRKAFEKTISCTEQSSTWTLTPESRSLSASSRRRTGATPPKQPPRLTSRERSTYHKDSSASDGKANTLHSKPIFRDIVTKSISKRIDTAVRAAERAGQYSTISLFLCIITIVTIACFSGGLHLSCVCSCRIG
jgi:hypothetical protein